MQDLYIERALERGLVGNVYLGKVARVLPGMQSAFIDVGLERAAFLHVADLHGGGHHVPKHDVGSYILTAALARLLEGVVLAKISAGIRIAPTLSQPDSGDPKVSASTSRATRFYATSSTIAFAAFYATGR